MNINGLTKEMINFETEISKMDFSFLFTKDISLLNISKYQIEYFCLSHLIKIYDPHNEVFIDQCQLVLNFKMKNLIHFIKSQSVNLLPPILEVSGNNLIIRDGKHRMGLCWNLGIETIPFLYLKSNHLKICKILE